ncbi:hypothetical protein L0664_04470 [Octadecabacter sp. G9-8]|uniref:Uncharacterized protein n=1 Tax=Octadecabacter dasysiphoniae TaxID=2909341 RepID=A0ABS9CT12_9RHOB|nr:hypothetical protein [Octadecabacter dasysiphoniae]MCF2870313.1 hypothetical protein [Octadecabacter dasysiphoniae]
MQDIVKQTIALVVGGVVVGLIMLLAERNIERDPELRILFQKTAIHREFMQAIVSGSVKYIDSVYAEDEEPLSDERLEQFSATVLDSSGLRFGGSLDTYYITNESADEPVVIQIISRNFEFAALGGDHGDEYYEDEVDIKVRLLPDESLYFVVATDNLVTTRYPDVNLDDQYVFFAVDEKPVIPISLHEYSSFDVYPENLVRKNPLVFALLSLVGLGSIALFGFVALLGLFLKNKIEFLARITSAKDIAQSQLVIDFVRDNRKNKFAQIEDELKVQREKYEVKE